MALEHDSDSPLALAVRKARSQTAFGKLIGKRQSLINDWLRLGKPLPVEHVPTVSAALDIPPEVLRPDLAHLFPKPAVPAGAPPSPLGYSSGGGANSDALAGVRT